MYLVIDFSAKHYVRLYITRIARKFKGYLLKHITIISIILKLFVNTVSNKYTFSNFQKKL